MGILNVPTLWVRELFELFQLRRAIVDGTKYPEAMPSSTSQPMLEMVNSTFEVPVSCKQDKEPNIGEIQRRHNHGAILSKELAM